MFVYTNCAIYSSSGGVLSPNEREQQIESTQVDSSSAPSQESIIEPVDMDETL